MKHFTVLIANSMLVFAEVHSSLQIQTFLSYPHKWKNICYFIYKFNLYYLYHHYVSIPASHLHSSSIYPLKSILQIHFHTLFGFGLLNAMLDK